MHLLKQLWLLYASTGLMVILFIFGSVLIAFLTREVVQASRWNRHTQEVIKLHNATRTLSGQSYADLQLKRDPQAARSALIEALDTLREMVKDNPTQSANANDIKEATLYRFTALDTKVNEGVSVENLNRANTKFAETETNLMIEREADYTGKMWRILSTLVAVVMLFAVAFAVAIWATRNSLLVRLRVAERLEAYPAKNGLADILAQIKGARGQQF